MMGPITASICAGVIGPGRSKRSGVVVRSRTVDSRPAVVGPAFRSRSMRPSRPRKTCSAHVGDSSVDGRRGERHFGFPQQCQRDGMGWHPQGNRRTATRHEVGHRCAFGNTSVSGPGQKAG